MSIVNPLLPMTSGRAGRILEELADRYPFARLRELGRTIFGRPIQAIAIGEGPRQVLFTAAHHANEWLTATVLLKFAEDLCEAIAKGGNIWGVPAETIRRQVTVHLVPLVNPDGVDLVTGAIAPGTEEYDLALSLAGNYPDIPFPEGWKANLLGVDLNLQYPAGWLEARKIKFSQGYTLPGPRDYVGRAPLVQREVRALAEYTEAVDPKVVLAYHSQGQVIYWQFEDYEVPGARELGQEFSRVSGYRLEDTPYESAFAGYKDWFIQTFRRPGYTIEVGTGQNPLPVQQFDQIYAENLGILVTAATGLPGGA